MFKSRLSLDGLARVNGYVVLVLLFVELVFVLEVVELCLVEQLLLLLLDVVHKIR